jgi:hypothetical protein
VRKAAELTKSCFTCLAQLHSSCALVLGLSDSKRGSSPVVHDSDTCTLDAGARGVLGAHERCALTRCKLPDCVPAWRHPCSSAGRLRMPFWAKSMRGGSSRTAWRDIT